MPASDTTNDLKETTSQSNSFNYGIHVLSAPFFFLLTVYGLHYLFQHYLPYLASLGLPHKIIQLEPYFFGLSIAGCFYWVFLKLLNRTLLFLKQRVLPAQSPWVVLLPLMSTALKVLFFLVLFNNLTKQLPGPEAYLLDRVTSVLIISAIAWIVMKLVDVISHLLINRYIKAQPTIDRNRKFYTQILIAKRIAYTIIMILTLGSIFMLFDNVRALGASVLTTAGIAGLVITFTAQRSLASIFGGLEIALSQPIKIGDSVLVENQFGTVEEINFRHVVIKLWDWRHLILPVNYFLEKPFQNWTRHGNNHLISIVHLYVDFTLPVKVIREQLDQYLKESTFWDKKVGSLDVSEFQERVMKITVLASAANPDAAAKLQNELREKLITFICEHYPTCLPVTRSLANKTATSN